MDINSKAEDTLPTEIPITYPYLGVMDTGASKTITLFTSVNMGIILYSEAFPNTVGTFSKDVPENKYSLYHGSITLTM